MTEITIPKNYTKFMEKLLNLWIENGRSEKTAQQYLRNLVKLNEDKPFNNLSFLKNVDKINDEIIVNYISKRHLYGTILSAIKLTNNKTYNKTYNEWNSKLMKYLDGDDEEKLMENRKVKYDDNYMPWDDIIKKRDELETKARKLKKVKDNKDWKLLLQMLVLSLYTLLPPRRNEYVLMEVVPKVVLSEENDKKNYYGKDTSTFVFNEYKTKKNYGKFIVNIPKSLDNVIKLYLKYSPLKGGENTPLLHNWDGKPLSKINGIQKVLYSIFKPKKIGSTMLRHIYLTDKYGNTKKEAEMDAEAMGHSVKEAQETYVK